MAQPALAYHSDAEPISELRPSLRRSLLPPPATLLLVDLLLGACHADGHFCEEEHAAVRAALRRILRVDELSPEIDERIASFDPAKFDLGATARSLVEITGAAKRSLLEVVCEMCAADERLELCENEYMLAIVMALAMGRHEYVGLAVKSAIDERGAAIKRVEDLVLGSIALGALALPMLAIAAGVKLTSRGPVLFKQRRYGTGGREFEIYKFRTMTTAENGDHVAQAKKNDSRVTRFGAFLRRHSLDELPQLFNVLAGDMSLVGPRPHATAHNEMYRELILRYMLRHQVKPGITGHAQVNGWRGETDTLEKMANRVEHDLAYVEAWTPFWDLEIMFLTIFGRKVRMNAY